MDTSLNTNNYASYNSMPVKNNRQNIAFGSSARQARHFVQKKRTVKSALLSLREKMIHYALEGKYIKYVRARKAYARTYVQHPQEASFMQPFVAKAGMDKPKPIWNTLKVCIRDLFRKKSPEEKQMEEMYRRLNAERRKAERETKTQKTTSCKIN